MRTAELRSLDRDAGFDRFVERTEPGLRRALTARFGEPAGREATVDALAYAWLNWARLAGMTNPAGYLYRVGVRATQRSSARALRLVPTEGAAGRDENGEGTRTADYEPALPGALARLSANQRTAVLLVHGWHYTHAEAADLLGVSESTLRTHVERGLARLRREIGGAG